MEIPGLKKNGEGREKIAYDLGDRVWKLNKENHEDDRWLRASDAIHFILQELFPDNFPRIFSTEQLVEEVGDSLQRGVLREVEKIKGFKIQPILGQFFQRRIDNFSDMLEEVGVMGALDPVPQNFILVKKDRRKREMVYIDTLNPYTIASRNRPSRRAIDIEKIEKTIRERFSEPQDENKLESLLNHLKKYRELTEGMETDVPTSFYRKKH